MHKAEVVIKDACILFDLIDLEILDCFYQLDLIVFTTSQVIAEISDNTQLNTTNSYIDSGKLVIDHYGSYETIAQLYNANPGLSFSDCSVLEVAIRKDATILSSDKSLRNESSRRNITVRGVLWILEELYIQDIIKKEDLLQKLHVYPKINKRVPKNEIEKLINRLT